MHEGFRMNEKREILFRQRIIHLNCQGIEMSASRDWEMAALYFGDLADMLDILSYLNRARPIGDGGGSCVWKATEKWKNLDTAARDKYPAFVCELAGWAQRTPPPEETLEGTKD
jgi:hypothetical protein